MQKRKFKTWLEQVEESNAEFDKMSKAEKRVQIAKDVIARMNMKQLLPASVFVDSKSGERIDLREGDSIKDTLNGMECRACAKGGLFLAYVGRVNRLQADGYCDLQIEPSTKEMRKLKQIFTQRQLDLMEVVYEGVFDYSWTITDFSDTLIEKALKFHKSFKGNKEADKRLRAICQNLIDNKGTFKL